MVAFLAEPVLSGFTTSSAFLIATSQASSFLGITVAKGGFFETWIALFSHIKEINWTTFIIGVVCFISLYLIRLANLKLKEKYNAKIPIPGELLMVVISTVIVGYGNFVELYDVKVCGDIPPGLPTAQAPDLGYMKEVLSASVVITLVLYIISMSISITFANKFDYEVDANQELLALGLSNIFGGIFLGYPACGSLSRSAVVANIGGKTPIHNIYSVALIALVLAFLTAPLRNLPMSCLAAIIFMALRSLFLQLSEPFRLWKIHTPDCLMWLGTFVATLVLGATYGIMVGVGISVMMLVSRTSRPGYAVLGVLPDAMKDDDGNVINVFVDVKRYKEARERDGVLIFRFDGALHFANKAYFKARLLKCLQRRKGITSVILDMSAVNDIDSAALSLMWKVAEAHHDIEFLVAAAKDKVLDKMKIVGFKSGAIDLPGLFVTLNHAVADVRRRSVTSICIEGGSDGGSEGIALESSQSNTSGVNGANGQANEHKDKDEVKDEVEDDSELQAEV